MFNRTLPLFGGRVFTYPHAAENKKLQRRKDMAKVELKQPIVQEIAETLKDAQSAVVVDYRGLTVE